ncbi:MAG: hypothetical protein FWB78_01900 [Treponema sp.]|nr:hypothetical protein [Treponema sp.]
MFGLFTKRKANKSKMKLANQFDDIAGITSDGETRQELSLLRSKILRQARFPSNWKALDDELFTLLYQVRNQVDLQNVSTVGVYLEHINNLVDTRASQDKYVVDEFSKNLLELKVQVHEKVDNVKSLIHKNAVNLKKIERTPPGDPTLYMLESEKKACEATYYDISLKIKHLASIITEMMTRLKPEDIVFYERLRGLQGVPAEIEEQTAIYLFHQHKFETIADENQRIIESRYADAEAMPLSATMTIPAPESLLQAQKQDEREVSADPAGISATKRKQIETECFIQTS